MHTEPFTTTEAERAAARVVEKRRARRLAHLAPELVTLLRSMLQELDGPMMGYWTERMDNLTRSARELLAGIDSDLPTEDATVKRLADTLRHISCNIGAFARQCKEVEHTDTDEAWALFNRIRNWCRSALRR